MSRHRFFAGAVLLGSAGYRARLLRALETVGILATPLALVSEPTQGAIRLALASAAR